MYDQINKPTRTKRRIGLAALVLGEHLTKWPALEKTAYFKGVPIYLVKVNEGRVNFFAEQYYNTINLIDNTYGRILNTLNASIGFGNNWLIQGSLQKQNPNLKTKIYVFFERSAAINFCQNKSNQISRYKGSRCKLFEPLTKQPKMFVYNLEDFIEIYEETLLKNQPDHFDPKLIQFVPSEQAILDVEKYYNKPKTLSLQKVGQFFNFKCRRLIGFCEMILNTN